MPLFLGIPLWAWLVGGAVGTTVVIDQTGDTAEQMGEAAQKSANLAKWIVAGGVLYVGYQMAKKGGVA